MRKRHPLYKAFMAAMLLLLIAGIALLLSGMLTPDMPVRPRVSLPLIARCGLYG